MSDYTELIESLRKWIAKQDAPVRAAVQLLIDQGHWFHDHEFVRECVGTDDWQYYVMWWRVRELLDEGRFTASGGEMAVLRAAVALACDTLGLSSLDRINRQAVVDAFATALGVPFAVSFPNEVRG